VIFYAFSAAKNKQLACLLIFSKKSYLFRESQVIGKRPIVNRFVKDLERSTLGLIPVRSEKQE
jgi:hypothetical protein